MSSEDTIQKPREGNGKTVNDEEKQSQTATIRRIQSYRDNIAEYQRFFAQNEITHELDAKQQHRSYHQLVKGFLQLLKPYLLDEDIDVAKAYWQDIGLGSFEVTPPEVLSQPARNEVESALGNRDRQTVARADPRNRVSPHRYRVEGLQDFDAAEMEWDVSWTVMFGPGMSPADLRKKINDDDVRVAERTHRNEPITVIRTARVPRPILNNVVTALENFVRDIGLDIDFSDSGLPDWGYFEVNEDGQD